MKNYGHYHSRKLKSFLLVVLCCFLTMQLCGMKKKDESWLRERITWLQNIFEVTCAGGCWCNVMSGNNVVEPQKRMYQYCREEKCLSKNFLRELLTTISPRRIQMLGIDGCYFGGSVQPFRDKDLFGIVKCQNLKTVSVAWSAITNRFLERLPLSVENLSVANTEVDDVGLETLKKRGLQLKKLNLNGCKKITDEGLKFLTQYDFLELNIGNCKQLTNEGLINFFKKYFKKYPQNIEPKLQVLSLDSCDVKDVVDQYVIKLPNLRIIWLNETRGMAPEDLHKFLKNDTLQEVSVSPRKKDDFDESESQGESQNCLSVGGWQNPREGTYIRGDGGLGRRRNSFVLYGYEGDSDSE